MDLDDLAKLERDWDSHGAMKPWPQCIAEARKISDGLPGADFFPISDGGVLIEVSDGAGGEVSITIDFEPPSP